MEAERKTEGRNGMKQGTEVGVDAWRLWGKLTEIIIRGVFCIKERKKGRYIERKF